MFGNLIKTCRQQSGLSITELGAAIGKDASTISRWERGVVATTGAQTLAAIVGCGLEQKEAVRLITETLIAAICKDG